MKFRTGPYFASCLLLATLLGSPALAQDALVAEGMITPTDATTESEIVVVQMQTATEAPGPPFVVSVDPPRLALSSQAGPSGTPHDEPQSQNLGRLAAGAWQVHGYGVDWREAGSEPLFEGFSGPATFHVTTGEVHPKRMHPVAGEPLVLRVVGPGRASCAPLVDDVSVEGEPPEVVIRATQPDCSAQGGARFAVDVPVPPLAAGEYRAEVQVTTPRGNVEVYAGASFRVVPLGEPRLLELTVEPDPERYAHNLVAVVEIPNIATAEGCSSWNVAPRNAWAHGRNLYASFGLFPIAVQCGDAVTETYRFPLPELETGHYRILAQRRREGDVSEFWAQSKTLVEVEKLGRLIDDRFRVTVAWRDQQGQIGRGVPVPVTEDQETDSAIFYFFGDDNWELLVKVLDGCAINNHHWVFASASTDVEYVLTVEDLVSGAQAIYRNELGRASPAITDTAAFAACE